MKDEEVIQGSQHSFTKCKSYLKNQVAYEQVTCIQWTRRLQILAVWTSVKLSEIP